MYLNREGRFSGEVPKGENSLTKNVRLESKEGM
jgi:hypothetical protein